ncbi:MAG TPA: hypothetical protein VFR38_12940 [Gaiellaceae bacterium]|nr:hypothetical protein [Gaiellaceae bacterium]
MNDSIDLDVSGFMEEGDFDGQGRTFDAACEDAWQKAKKPPHNHGPGWYKVKHQWVYMENPVSEHKVIIGPAG